MKKHTYMAMLTVITVMIATFWGSMQSVSAIDTIKVEAAGVAKAKVITVSDAKGKKVATADEITIEVVRDTENSEKKDKSSTSTRSGSVAGIPYDSLVMADVEEAVNIRDAASEEGKIIGKFFKECAGTVIEKQDKWTKVKTGDITGWISNDYLMFGEKAIELANKVVEKTATCTADCLRVREEASQDASVLDLLAEGDQIGVVSVGDEWVKVEYSDGEIGYVSADYVEISDYLGTGESLEDIAARDALARKEKEEREAQAAKDKKDDKSQSESAGTASANTTPTATNTASTAAGYSDLVLLAALIQAEAGTQPYEGQVAIGNVVTNRLITGKYGNSIYSVIYAKSQFGPAGTGQVAQIAAAGPKASCMQAAQDALNGVNYVGTATHFRNIKSGYTGLVIGAHVFW